VNNAQTGGHGSQVRSNGTQARLNRLQSRLNNTHARLNNSSTRSAQAASASANRNHAAGTLNPSTTASLNATRPSFGSTYTYGSGAAARHYRAYGYGNGYRNRSYGSRYGYGRSQGNNRGIVSRLRSVHSSLARIDHDYQGHRVRAMRSIAMAIRQLSHRSMGFGRAGFASGMNNGLGAGMGRGLRQIGVGGGGVRGQVMPQAQSDARMSRALRTLQGIGMQLGNQGSNSMGHRQALGHIQHASQELNTALSIR
jgi:hypothetical protein